MTPRVTPVVRIATHDVDTVRAIHSALDSRTPIALLHPKLAPAELARQRALIEAAELGSDDAVILFTSGSTGVARGVVLSRAALDAASAASWEHLGHRPKDRWQCTLPLAHAGGLAIVVRCRAANVPVSLTRDPGATLISAVPAQLAEIVLSANLRAVLLGGGAAARPLVDAAIARGIPVLQTYGLTETFGQVATAREVGGPLVPLPGVAITGGTREAPARIRIAGPMLASRYLDGEAIAPELVTSDIGFVENGHLHVLGRVDEVIITGGEKIHPAQVEAVLAVTPGVHAVAVFGVPDARWGQVIAAVIATGTELDRERAFAAWHAQLPPHARPRRIAIVDALPVLASGKVDRRAVAALPTSPIEYR
jgi:O-succinylbenzoic acid--CoA ligase